MNVNKVDDSGHGPVLVATVHGKVKNFQLLIEWGATFGILEDHNNGAPSVLAHILRHRQTQLLTILFSARVVFTKNQMKIFEGNFVVLDLMTLLSRSWRANCFNQTLIGEIMFLVGSGYRITENNLRWLKENIFQCENLMLYCTHGLGLLKKYASTGQL
ncbi:hypothetical protein QAD02_017899 [Eretmocerus hayati]|uniref:Uncharacterized protein n=1 Tax=Eretmocerus hayati TaxID=131215 RepID=A0ACC2PI59_9HYME|nr:hypothetical protein QAD02_017899 [Eretmocerus hayati]